MKIGIWTKMPMWGRFLTILFGFPFAVALLQVSLEQWVSRLTADILVLAALIAVSLLLYLKRGSRQVSVPTSKDEMKQEARKVEFIFALLLALVFLAGGVIFLVIVVFPPTDLPSISRWVIRAASLFFGLLGLLLSLVFILECCMLVTGKRSLTIRLGKPKSHK